MSTNLGAAQLSGGMANPETAVNTATGRLDAAITEILTVDLTADVTLTQTQYQSAFRFDVTPSGVGKTLTLFAVKRLCLINNTSANDITVKLGTTSLTLPAGGCSFYYSDGTANGLILINPLSAAGPQPHDLHAFFPGKPAAAATILTGSIFKAITAATASATFTLKKNGSSIGTIVFAASSGTGTITFSAAVTFAAGDVITIEAPTPQDATLSDLSFNFLGNR
jgi:hypothetical protein